MTNSNIKDMRSLLSKSGLDIGEISDEEALQAWDTLLQWLGEDPQREGLIKTPERMLKIWKEDMFKGYFEAPALSTFKKSLYTEHGGYSGPVFLRDIDYKSTCEHHFAPFIGKISIGFLPDEKILGFSKFLRICEIHSKRLQTQERLTAEIGQSLQSILTPKALFLCLWAKHSCVSDPHVQVETQYAFGPDDLVAELRERLSE